MTELELLTVGRVSVDIHAQQDGTREPTPPFPVEVVCGLGAGDAFGGAVCHGLLSDWDPIRTVRYGSAAGAIVASQLMGADAMPTSAEVDLFVQDQEISA